jgi:hypothetical protein
VTEHHGRISALLVHDNVLYSASDDRTVLVWQEVSIPLSRFSALAVLSITLSLFFLCRFLRCCTLV